MMYMIATFLISAIGVALVVAFLAKRGDSFKDH